MKQFSVKYPWGIPLSPSELLANAEELDSDSDRVDYLTRWVYVAQAEIDRLQDLHLERTKFTDLILTERDKFKKEVKTLKHKIAKIVNIIMSADSGE